VFPKADRPIAVEWGRARCHHTAPIDGIEFVEEAVTVLGYSTELATHPPPSLVARKRTPPSRNRVPFQRVCPTSWGPG